MNVTWAGIAAIGVLLFTGYTGYRRGFIKEIVSFFFVFLALALAWMLNPYVNTFLMQKTSLYDKIQESCRELPGGQNVAEDDEGDEETEGSLISQLPLPEILQKNLTVNNTEEAYQYLAVDTFGDYISEYLARGNHKWTVVSDCLCTCESGVACSAACIGYDCGIAAYQ